MQYKYILHPDCANSCGGGGDSDDGLDYDDVEPGDDTADERWTIKAFFWRFADRASQFFKYIYLTISPTWCTKFVSQ